MSLTKATYSMIDGAPVNVRDFGATGNGGTNDTAAIKAALTALPNGRTLFFPSGTYLVTAGEIMISGKENISLIGEGTGTESSGVSFRVSGTGDITKNLLEIVASNGITISNIGFLGNSTNNPVNKSNIGVYIHRGPGYTSNISFYHCAFRYFTVGCHVGGLSGNESNNENIRYYACYFNSNTTGYRQYWPNALQNVHEDCYYTNNDYNIWLSDATVQTGSLVIRNANFAVTGVADVYFQLPSKLDIISFRVETTPQFIKSGGFQSSAFPGFLLVGGVIVNQTDDTLPIIDCKTSGFTAIDCRFGEINESKFWFNLPIYRSLANFVGCSFNAATSYGLNSTPGTYTFGGNDGYGQYVISGCREYNATDNAYVPLPEAYYKYTPFANASGATPSIKTRVCGLCPYLILTNATATIVTNFLDGYEGAEITVYIGANTTVLHSTLIVFKTATNKTTGAYKFLRYENAWYEI